MHHVPEPPPWSPADDLAEWRRAVDEVRRAYGWSQRTLAARAGVSASGWMAVARGAAEPSAVTVLKVSDVTGVTVIPRAVFAPSPHHLSTLKPPEPGRPITRAPTSTQGARPCST